MKNIPAKKQISQTNVSSLEIFVWNWFFDTQEVASSSLVPPNGGLLQWYMLPLLAAGLIAIIARFKTSVSVRMLLAFVLAYPAGDCLVWEPPLSSLRSFVGLCGLILVAALGAVFAAGWLWKRYKVLTFFATGIFIVVMLISNVCYFRSFFGHCREDTEVYHRLHSDLVEACQWLKPHFDAYDAVFCTNDGLNMPYVITTVALGYDPKLWFSQPRDFTTIGEWDNYTRCGKMHFMCYDLFPSMKDFIDKSLSSEQYRTGHVLLIIRPGEVRIPDPDRQIVHKIIRPDDTEVLWLCKI
ncbi:MAG: hypothetical protein MUP16_00290 [Sedimentisphaerales bacterium]|nr:hypothetical protein [Sedimentisphaerales bacterium]